MHENLRAAEDTDFAIRLALAGYRFRMLEEPGAVWHDRFDPERAVFGQRGAEDLRALAGDDAARHCRHAPIMADAAGPMPS